MREINASSFWDNTVTVFDAADEANVVAEADTTIEGKSERDIYLQILRDVAEILQRRPYFIDFSLRGAFNLNTHVEIARMTTDLDFDVLSRDSWERFIFEAEELLNARSAYGYGYRITKRRGYEKNPNGDSVEFEVTGAAGNLYNIKIDMNIKDSITPGSVPLEAMLCDKLHVFCSRTINRRIKDLIDINTIVTNLPSYFDVIEFRRLYWELYGEWPEYVYSLDEANHGMMEHALGKYRGRTESTTLEQYIANISDFLKEVWG